MSSTARALTALTTTLILAGRIAAVSADNWPQFRGSRAGVAADDPALPDTWSATENVVWKVDLPGRGWSSPIVWGDHVFVTAATKTARTDDPLQPVREEGDAYVMQAGPEFKRLGRNPLGEMTLATPAIANGSLIVRTASKLYRISKGR